MNNRSFIIVAVILIAVAVAANMPAKFSKGPEQQVSEFPRIVGDWQGVDFEVSERDYEILGTKNLFIRDYTNNNTGEVVNLYIIYSQDNRRALHPPEICYTGGGSTILEKSVIPVTDSIKANKFTIEGKGWQQLVVYWYKSPGFDSYDYLKQQIRVVLDRMMFKKTYGAMVRMAVVIKEKDEAVALETIRKFVGVIESELSRLLP